MASWPGLGNLIRRILRPNFLRATRIGSRHARTPLLRLKYQDSIADVVADLGGKPEEIGKAFAGFQKYPYPAVV